MIQKFLLKQRDVAQLKSDTTLFETNMIAGNSSVGFEATNIDHDDERRNCCHGQLSKLDKEDPIYLTADP